MYLACNVTSQDNIIKESREFMGGSLSWYVTSLNSLVGDITF